MYNDNQTSTKGARTDWEDLKMKVHVFDTYVTIKDREGHPDMDDTLLEKLDEMLTTYVCPTLLPFPTKRLWKIARKLLLKLPMILLMI